jgi:LCP family protein required for cell wall assembly
MQKHRNILWFFSILALGATVSGVYLLYKWNKPLGPGLFLPTYTPTTNPLTSISSISTSPDPEGSFSPVEVVSSSEAVMISTLEANTIRLATPHPYPTATSQPLCGGPATMTILAIGSDQRGTGYLYGLADSIHVVRIDFTVPNIMVIDFPRDLWVEIPDISDHYGITHGKLNQAYLFGNPGMGYYDGPGDGPGLMARTLDFNFGLRVDHYIAIDTQTFVRFIDAVGGVDIQVESPINLNYGMITPDPRFYLSVGSQHLDGELALKLATNRIPSTFQRMKYQKIILSALREKLLSVDMFPKLPKLVTQFITSVQTDLSLSDINNLICIAQAVPKENMQADSFPQGMFTANVTFDENRNVTSFVYNADFGKLRAMIADFMNGIWPMP